jgi:hypothetical protein
MDSKNGKELIMADINYLIAQGNLPRIQPMDIQDAEKNALLNQRTRMQNQFIPEEQNFTRQKMGQETTTFNQGQDDRMRELSRRSFKDNNEAFDTMIEQMPMVTWETYGASREWFIRHGMRADMLPEPAAIEKLAAQKGDTPDIAFEKFKEYTIPMAKRKREEMKLGVEEKKVGIAETQANRPIVQPGNSRLATATGQPIPGSEVTGKETNITLDQLIAKKVMDGEMTLEEALQAKREKDVKDTPAQADSDYRKLLERENLGEKLSKEDLAKKKAYETQKLLVPTTTANIRIGGFSNQQATNLPPGYTFHRPTGTYKDPDGKTIGRRELQIAFGERAVMDADKSAYRDLDKRGELIATFVNRIEANSPIVQNALKELGNKDSKLLNMPMNKVKQYLGAGEWNALQLALKSLSNEIAKVESGSLGIAEVSAEQARDMKKIHDSNLSLQDMKKVLDMGILLGKTSKGALLKQKKELARRIPQIELEGEANPGEEPPPIKSEKPDYEYIPGKGLVKVK